MSQMDLTALFKDCRVLYILPLSFFLFAIFARARRGLSRIITVGARRAVPLQFPTECPAQNGRGQFVDNVQFFLDCLAGLLG